YSCPGSDRVYRFAGRRGRGPHESGLVLGAIGSHLERTLFHIGVGRVLGFGPAGQAIGPAVRLHPTGAPRDFGMDTENFIVSRASLLERLQARRQKDLTSYPFRMIEDYGVKFPAWTRLVLSFITQGGAV